MSTYNGEKYLAEQIDSILSQKDVHVELFVRDDGSTDGTREILSRYAELHGNIHLEFSENLGWRKSFLCALISAPEFDFYAFSDQDDFWINEKLITAVKAIRAKEKLHGSNIPIVWQSNIYVTDENLNILYIKRIEKRIYTLGAALTRLYARGCSMVMNAKTRELVRDKWTQSFSSVFGHDYGTLFLTCLAGGIVICDPRVCMYYRQNSDNLIGTTTSLMGRIKKEYNTLVHMRGDRIREAKTVLQNCDWELSPETRKMLETVAQHKESWLCRLRIIFSPKFRTGDIRLTTVSKLKALFGWM